MSGGKLWGGILLLLVAAALVLIFRAGSQPAEPPPIPQERYLPPSPPPAPLPPQPFRDVTTEAGLDFQHETGGFRLPDGSDSRYLPECMGPGVVLFDPDADGDLDLFVANGCAFPGRPPAAPAPTSRLFLNEGRWHFRDVTATSGLGVVAYAMGGAAADVDGDGDQDFLLTTWGGPRLFRNAGIGAVPWFEEVTSEAGLESAGWTDEEGRTGPDWSTSAAFFDVDRDGDLDLWVANYVRWSPETDVFATLDGRRKSFTIPDRYHGNSCRLYLNQGQGRFRDATREADVRNEEGKSLGIALWDFDQDGSLDVVVANDTQPNFFYRNLGNGRFEECGLRAGIAYDENARTRAGMGIDVADYANDGVPGVPIGNFSNEPVALYRMVGPGFFRDVTQQTGVAAVTQLLLTFGLAFADLDLDGFQDLVMANGHLEPHIQEIQAEVSYAQPPLLLRNLGNGRFQDWSPQAGPPFQTPLVGRGLAVGDLDQDGDLDLVIATNGGPVHLLSNERPPGEHWLRVHLRGRPPNTEAIGARVTLTAGDLVQHRIVRTGSSYLSQSELTLTFGLGGRSSLDRLEITWPDGALQVVEPPPEVDQTVVVARRFWPPPLRRARSLEAG